MPILHVIDTPTRLVIFQCAMCGLAQSVPLEKLTLGTASDPNAVVVPMCKCGAQEMLSRTFDAAPELLAGHRKKVNALAVALKEAEQLHEKHADAIKKETIAPIQVGDLVGPVELYGLPDVVLPPGMKLPCNP